MPCYSRETSTIEFGAATNVSLLEKALTAAGYDVTQMPGGLRITAGPASATGQFVNGVLTLNATRPVDMPALKRAYSAEIIKTAAQRFGWNVKQPSPEKFVVQRRF